MKLSRSPLLRVLVFVMMDGTWAEAVNSSIHFEEKLPMEEN